MNKNEKLKIVFDFIADYLTDNEVKETKSEPKEDVNDYSLTETEDKYKRAYSLMKKIDERDKIETAKNIAVREATNPLKKALLEAKSTHEDILIKDKEEEEKEIITESNLMGKFREKTGVTINEEGKVTEVKVGNLRDYVPISDIIEDEGPSLNDVRDQDHDKTIVRGFKLKSILDESKNKLND